MISAPVASTDISCPKDLTFCQFCLISSDDLMDIVLHLKPSSSRVDIMPSRFLLQVFEVVALQLLSIVIQAPITETALLRVSNDVLMMLVTAQSLFY